MGLFSRLFIAVILIVAVPYYWLLLDAGPRGSRVTPIDIPAIRRLAASVPGQRPISVEYAPLAVRQMAGTILVAGGGLRVQTVAKIAFRLVTPGGDTVIDTGPTEAQAADVGFKHFNFEARRLADTWTQGARQVVFTHEHPDFVGSLIASEAFTPLAAKTILTRRQAEIMDRMRPGVIDEVGQIVPSDRLLAVAPGIVLVPAPGHSPGSQLIYVQLSDGREYLFAGDTATMERNVTWLRPRSRLASSWQGGEDREAVIGLLKGLADATARYPELRVVYGGDLAWLQNARQGPGFSSAFRYGGQEPDGY